MISRKSTHLDMTVYEAALDRVRYVYDECDDVIVAMSGGKDSTVVFHLACVVAKERGQLPATGKGCLARSGSGVARDGPLYAGNHVFARCPAVLDAVPVPADEQPFAHRSLPPVLGSRGARSMDPGAGPDQHQGQSVRAA